MVMVVSAFESIVSDVMVICRGLSERTVHTQSAKARACSRECRIFDGCSAATSGEERHYERRMRRGGGEDGNKQCGGMADVTLLVWKGGQV